MGPTKALREEHGLSMKMFAVLKGFSERNENFTGITRGHMEKILEFLKVFVDECHHGKEEEVLFPALDETGEADVRDMIRGLIEEHRIGREVLAEMERALEQAHKKEGNAVFQFCDAAQRYTDLMRPHIRRENGILFPVADKMLSEERKEQIAEQFRQLEREKIGEGRHEAFHHLVEELTGIYR